MGRKSIRNPKQCFNLGRNLQRKTNSNRPIHLLGGIFSNRKQPNNFQKRNCDGGKIKPILLKQNQWFYYSYLHYLLLF